MAVTAPIPLPQAGYQAFDQSLAGTQNIFNSLIRNKQKDRELTETEKYHTGTLHIQQQEADRARALLPYLEQQYADAHDKSPLERQYLKMQIDQAQEAIRNTQLTRKMQGQTLGFDENGNIIPDEATPSAPNPQAPLPGAPGAAGGLSAIPGGSAPSAIPDQTASIAPSLARSQSLMNNMTTINGDNTNMPFTPAGNPNALNAAQSGITGFQNSPVPASQMPRAATPMPNQSPMPTPAGISPTTTVPAAQLAAAPISAGAEGQIQDDNKPKLTPDENGVIELVPANPRKKNWDRAPGSTIMGIKIPDIKQQTVGGRIITTYPSGRVLSMKAGESPREVAFDKADAKNVADIDKQAVAGVDISSSINHLSDVVNSPEWKGIHKNNFLNKFPLGNKAQVAAAAYLGTPEQQQVAGDFYTTSGAIVGDFASKFKGQFRRGEQTLVTGMKPNSGDSIGVQQGKIKGIQILNDFYTKERELISRYVRDDRMSFPDALDRADRELKGAVVRKYVKDMVGQSNIERTNKLNEQSGEATAPKIGREHVTEENIKETMEQTGLSREKVLEKLRERGLTE